MRSSSRPRQSGGRFFISVTIVSLCFLTACADGSVAPGRAKPDPEFPAFSVTPGTTLRDINLNHEFCGLYPGIAFDGTNLIVSCSMAANLDFRSPATGALVRSIVVVPSDIRFRMSSLGPMAWDQSRGKIWLCVNGGFVFLVDPVTGTATNMFVAGCFHGLAFDGADGTIWTGDGKAVSHYSASGTLLSTTNVNLGGYDISGIAAGTAKLYLSTDDGPTIYEAAKDFSTSSVFATVSPPAVDLECDEVTFAAQGTGALWVNHRNDGHLVAYALPPGACNFGGGTHGPLTSYPSQAYRGHIILCNNINSPGDRYYTFTIGSSGVIAGDIVQTSATVNPGQCRVVLVRTTQSVGNVTLTITESSGTGYVVGSITRQQLGGGPQNFSGPSPTIEVQANSDQGAVVTYNNIHPAG